MHRSRIEAISFGRCLLRNNSLGLLCDILASRNQLAFYMYIESKNVTREKAGMLKDTGGNLTFESDDVDEVLSEYFISSPATGEGRCQVIGAVPTLFL